MVGDYGSMATLGRMLQQKADANPERVAFTFLTFEQSGSQAAERLTLGDLFRRAQSVAGQLQQACKPRDRVLILCPPGTDYIAAFYGCQLAGVVAVPMSPPRNPGHMERVLAIMADAEAGAILCTAELADRAAALQAKLPPLIAIESNNPEHAETWRDPGVAADDLSFLQYTSGTTGTPKGVMVQHRHVLDNVANIVELTGLDASSTVVQWLPPYHDMGLIGGLISGVYGDYPTVLMAPAAFIERPLRWLEVISDVRATLTTGPNFAYQLCVDRATDEDVGRLDLSTLQTAASGSEPVSYDTMSAFAERFAPAGFRYDSFRAIYGMAETVLMTVGRLEEPRGPRSFAINRKALQTGVIDLVGRVHEGDQVDSAADHVVVTTCGKPLLRHHVRVVDPETMRACPDNKVGEIWVSGPSVAAGYWGKEAATQAAFQAHVVDDPEDSRPYLRTGDLGALIDGEICVLGRMKETIIIGGRRHYAQDIEATVAASSGGGQNAIVAFGLDIADTGQLIVVKEHHGRVPRGADGDQYFATIRQAVLDRHGVDPAAILLVNTRGLPRTTSGKLRRARARQLFAAGEIGSIAGWQGPAMGRPGQLSDLSRETADARIAWLRHYGENRINSRVMDERRMIAPHVALDFGRQGLLGLQVPEYVGGLGLSHTDTMRLIQQVAAIDLTLALLLGNHNALGLQTIYRAARPELRDRILPDLASGRGLAGFALSEPSAGSNPRAMRATAVPVGPGQWRISGQKSWIGSAAWASHICVFCRMVDERGNLVGLSGFVVEADAPGVRMGPEALTMGMRGMVQNTVFFEDVLVTENEMLATPRDGFLVAAQALLRGRMGLGAVCVGAMKRCAVLMSRYASRRPVHTGRLIDNQVTRERLADIIAKIAAADALVDLCAGRLDRGKQVPEDIYTVLKMSAPEFLWQAADRLVQALGARGYVESNPAAQLLRDARVFRIFEGPTETVGTYLGVRLLDQTSALPTFLRQELGASAIADRIDALIAHVRAMETDERHFGQALRLAEAAMFGTLVACLEGADSDADARRRLAIEAMTRLFEGAVSAVREGPSIAAPAASICESMIARYEDTIGNVEQSLPGGDVELSPELRRDTKSSANA